MMNIYFNNDPRPLAEGSRLSDLLQELQLINSKGIAVSVNNQIISRKDWGSKNIMDNDKVVIIRASQGG